jgi:hypothetical protein
MVPGKPPTELGPDADLHGTVPVTQKEANAMFRVLLAAAAVATALSGCGAPAASQSPPAAAGAALGPVDQGHIGGWHGGDAVLYATVGFFSPSPEIVAAGSVRADGSFSVAYPATLPAAVLSRPGDQCSTIQATDPTASTAFTANDLVFQHGMLVGAIHSGTSPGVAAFTSIANGDTRTGYVFTDRDTTTSGYCERTVSFGGRAVDFRQNLALRLRRGWNVVVADFSTPQPGTVVSDLRVGSNRSSERFFLFQPGAQR